MCQSYTAVRGPLDYWTESGSEAFGESRITYHVNHSIAAMLIHSVYSSSKVSAKGNEKLIFTQTYLIICLLRK